MKELKKPNLLDVIDRTTEARAQEFLHGLPEEKKALVTPALDARWNLAGEMQIEGGRLNAAMQVMQAGIMRIPHVWAGDAGIRELEQGMDMLEDIVKCIRGRVAVARTRGAVIDG